MHGHRIRIRPSRLLSCPSLTLEQLADLEIDSVYSASLYTQKVTEAPSSVTIVAADEIKRYGYRTLADILRSVRGFYVTYDRNYSYLGVRGFSRPGDYNARILLMVDGHRLNDNIFGAALIGTEFPAGHRSHRARRDHPRTELVAVWHERILRRDQCDYETPRYDEGPRGGRITCQSPHAKRPASPSAANSIAASTSSCQDRRTEATARRGSSLKSSPAPATNNGFAENADADRFSKFFGRMTFEHFTLQGLYGAREKAIPTASFGTVFNDPRSQTVERQGFVDLQYDRDDTEQLGNRLAGVCRLVRVRRRLRIRLFRDRRSASWSSTKISRVATGGGLSSNSHGKLQQRNTLTIGTEYRNNFRQDQFNYDQEPFLEHLDDRRSSTNWALYLQDEVALHRTLLLNVGLRHDHYDTFGGTTNPRAGLIYSPFTKTTVKALYGQAFRAPNAYELFWQQQDVAQSNPSLRPETNKTTELVLEQYLGTHVRVAAAGFHYGINGLITQQTDPVSNLLVYNNVESIRVKGLELEARRQVAQWGTCAGRPYRSRTAATTTPVSA